MTLERRKSKGGGKRYLVRVFQDNVNIRVDIVHSRPPLARQDPALANNIVHFYQWVSGDGLL